MNAQKPNTPPFKKNEEKKQDLKNTNNTPECTYKLIESIFPGLLAKAQTPYEDEDDKIFTEFFQIMVQYFPFWEDFKKYKEGMDISQHTFKVIYSLSLDPEFQTLSLQDQQLLLITAIFHDTRKRYPPHICTIDQRDPAHPFHSADHAFWFIFTKQLANISNSQYQEWRAVFDSGAIKQMEQFYSQLVFEVNNMEKLPDLIIVLNKYLTLRPEDVIWRDMIVLILIHQAFPSYQWPPTSPFIKYPGDVPKILDKRLLLLIKIFWKNDSLSYNSKDKIERKEKVEFLDEIEAVISEAFQAFDT